MVSIPHDAVPPPDSGASGSHRLRGTRSTWMWASAEDIPRSVTRECHQQMKRWMASLAWSWNDALARSGKISVWSTMGPFILPAALA